MKNVLIVLFICGILSSLLYIATDIFTGLSWPGYSFNSQTISELSAIGAPTRPIWLTMTFVNNPLLIAFGIGVFIGARNNRAQKITGILLIVWGTLGFLWLLFPMHLRGAIKSTTDVMHMVMIGGSIVLITTIIIVGSKTQGKKFLMYTILTLVVMFIFGIATFLQAPRVPMLLPTTWMGITERVSSYASLIWIIVLAVLLIRNEKKDAQ